MNHSGLLGALWKFLATLLRTFVGSRQRHWRQPSRTDQQRPKSPEIPGDSGLGQWHVGARAGLYMVHPALDRELARNA